MKQFTICEVQKHQSDNDCWIISHNFVYDVTKFLDKHPGGKKSILYKSGQDVSFEYDFHCNKEIWKKYLIGQIIYCNCCKKIE